MNNLDQCLGLHERLYVLYVVDGYVAQLQHEASNLVYAEGKGETIEEALKDLDAKLTGGPNWRIVARTGF